MVLGVPIFNHFRVSDQTIVMQAYLSKFEGECVGWGRGGVGGGGGERGLCCCSITTFHGF